MLKINSFKKEFCDIQNIIKDAYSLIRYKFEKKRIKEDIRFADSPLIFCDRNQIQHVILNLLINAQDAMGNNDRLSIITKLSSDNNKIEIRISDTGKGIPEKIRHKIFDFYYTYGKSNGTGLGLPISRYILENHNGTINYAPNKANKGSIFTITLPINGE